MHATYTVARVDPDAIWIVDDDQPMNRSITNDTEHVIMQVTKEFGPARRIFYRDSMDHWDELLRDGNRFIGFAFGTDGRKPPL